MSLKAFGKGAAIYAVGNLFLRGIVFLLIPVYTHGLSIADYGVLATLLLTIQMLNTVLDLGSQKAFVRFAAENGSELQQRDLLGNSILINIIGGLLVSGIVLGFLLPFFEMTLKAGDIKNLLWLTCGAALSQSLYLNTVAYYRARNESIKYLIACLPAPMALVIANLWLLFVEGKGIEGALMANIFCYGFAWLLIAVVIFSRRLPRITWRQLSKLFKFGFPLIFVSPTNLILDTFAAYLLNYKFSSEAVAIYSLAQKLAQIVEMLFTLPFLMAYEPYVYSNASRPGIQTAMGRLLTYLILGFILFSIIIILAAPFLISLAAPPQYYPAYEVLFLLLPGVGVTAVYYFSQSLLYIKNRTSLAAVIVPCLTALSLLLNYDLTSTYAQYGSAAAYSITQATIALIMLTVGLRIFPIKIEIVRLMVTLGLAVLFLAGTYRLHEMESLVYYGITSGTLLLVLMLMYLCKFFKEDEVLFFKRLLLLPKPTRG
ncbi:lipopolysaccharide biosynthesis protein [Methylomagnum sp.]